MRIEAGLSTYEKELALMGEDYQDIFRPVSYTHLDVYKRQSLP